MKLFSTSFIRTMLVYFVDFKNINNFIFDGLKLVIPFQARRDTKKSKKENRFHKK